MTRSGLIVTGLVGLALVAGVVVVTMNKSSNNQVSNNSATTPSASTPADNSQAPVAATITYSDSGFSPSSITVKSGDSIAIKNTSSQAMQLDSDPHPVHTDDPELNVGTVDSGKTVTFKVSTTGSHGVHNHLDSSKKMTIIVQ